MPKIATAILALLILVVGGAWLYRAYRLPQPSPAPSQLLVSSVTYRCDAGKKIQAAYYQGSSTPVKAGEPPVPNGRVVLNLNDGRNLTLPQTISGSGIRYANADESFIFWSKGETAFVQEGEQQTYSNCAEAPATLSQDLSPLYGAVRWNTPAHESVTIGTTTFSGVSVTSDSIKNTMDPGSIFTPFEQYYAHKLAALGWSVDNYLAAGGHVGGQTGYQKESHVILTRFAITYHNVPHDAPSECPCDVTLSLFSAEAP